MMDAVEFLIEKARYCNVNGCCCEKCTIYNECGIALNKLTRKQAERMVDVIDKWAKEHPIKTRQSEFLKIFPNMKIEGGAIDFCPAKLGMAPQEPSILNSCIYTHDCKFCINCKRDFWLQEIE